MNVCNTLAGKLPENFLFFYKFRYIVALRHVWLALTENAKAINCSTSSRLSHEISSVTREKKKVFFSDDLYLFAPVVKYFHWLSRTDTEQSRSEGENVALAGINN